MENALSDIKAVANETRAHIMTVEHKVETVQTNARSLQSWIQSLDGTQADINQRQGLLNHKSKGHEDRLLEG
ncbi:hypothetical protein DPMN_043382 [Dreissena polymorpha]|uniref:Uncharacterized protein n=1 Tax=Dreissena polymorpha TaxID=45954 RepID=A0A9D4HXS8_DREPO|nr:hypothetical protein DPMN_043382 [Dreissena polymorpha]